MDWWMDFIRNYKIYDVNFHAEETRYCKIMGCTNVAYKKSNLLAHNGKQHIMKMEQEYAPFWDILKTNAIRKLQVGMTNYSRISIYSELKAQI
jgi:CTP:phosphocholine cytidylyltransferase-like protein